VNQQNIRLCLGYTSREIDIDDDIKREIDDDDNLEPVGPTWAAGVLLSGDARRCISIAYVFP
jgi:hypothetical protein